MTTRPVRVLDAPAELPELGYCVVPGVLDPAVTAALGRRLTAVAAAEEKAGRAWLEPPASQRIWMLLNKGPEFVALAEQPRALEVAAALLGRDFLLSNITANLVGPGRKGQALHADQDFFPGPWPYAAVVTVVWMIDDFTEDTGATRVVPGSHLRHGPPAAGSATTPLVGSAGSMGVLDGRLWHGAGPNVSRSVRRRAVLCNYCRPFLRQQENFLCSIRPDLLAAASPGLLQLLGSRPYESLGMVNGLGPEWQAVAAQEFGSSWR